MFLRYRKAIQEHHNYLFQNYHENVNKILSDLKLRNSKETFDIRYQHMRLCASGATLIHDKYPVKPWDGIYTALIMAG